MASEKQIKQVLEFITTTPPTRIENLRREAGAPAKSMRRIVGTKNIVAVGISEKISKKKPTGKLALTFYVEKKLPLRKLRAEQLIPPTVPEALSGPTAVPTDVVAIGKIRPEVNAKRSPIQPGHSIGHVDTTAGTFGAVVRKGKQLHLLSNSHVFAQSGVGKKGDGILYPGDTDGGAAEADIVATLAAFKPFERGGSFVNRADCAIAKPTAARTGDLVSEIKGLGLVKGKVKPRRGMKVVKVGRTTGKTTGTVRDVNFRFVLDYGDGIGEVGFIDQVLCSRYTKPGDSGSLVIDKASRRAVGLHFAGANGGSVFNPIDDVLSALGVTLVTRSISSRQAAGAQTKRRKTQTRKRAGTKKTTLRKRRPTTKRKPTPRSRLR